jgi:hypothetical protein
MSMDLYDISAQPRSAHGRNCFRFICNVFVGNNSEWPERFPGKKLSSLA